MSDGNADWPSVDEFDTMTDTELLEHAVDVRQAKADEREAGTAEDERFGYLCDLRREQIRDVLKARLANRGGGFDTDPDLDDYDGDLEAAVFAGRSITDASC